jgi:hypothetical protein
MNLVAPSPSRTISCASVLRHSMSRHRATRDRPESVEVIAGSADLPEAITINESLVEVSPSMVMQLNERSAACLTRVSSTGCATAASQARKPSMVAMFGRIMPAPLLMPTA